MSLTRKTPTDRVLVLARVAGAIAAGSNDAIYVALAADADAANVEAEEIIGALLAVAPLVGSAKLVDAAPQVARAIGYDIDAALEMYEGA